MNTNDDDVKNMWMKNVTSHLINKPKLKGNIT